MLLSTASIFDSIWLHLVLLSRSVLAVAWALIAVSRSCRVVVTDGFLGCNSGGAWEVLGLGLAGRLLVGGVPGRVGGLPAASVPGVVCAEALLSLLGDWSGGDPGWHSLSRYLVPSISTVCQGWSLFAWSVDDCGCDAVDGCAEGSTGGAKVGLRENL